MASLSDLAADARTLLRLMRGQPRTGSHADRLQAFYAPQADRYDAFRQRLLQGRQELLDELDLHPGSHVVELGCGTGSSLNFIGERLHALSRFDMVDLCPALLAVARQRCAPFAAVKVIEADATLWRPERAVDVVFMSYALTMMPDWPAVIANAHAMLRPGGLFGIVDFHLPGGLERPANLFWKHWFAHDGVHLSAEHLSSLRQTFIERQGAECRAAVPYLPLLRAPYYRFIGIRN